MANRVLSEKIKNSPTLARCSFEAASAFLWTLTEADPLGRLIDSPDALAFAVFPARPDVDVIRRKFSGWIREWEAAGLVFRYEVDGRKCIQIVKWAEYQRIHDGARSKYPDPPEVPGSSGKFRESAGSCCSDSMSDSDSDSDSDSGTTAGPSDAAMPKPSPKPGKKTKTGAKTNDAMFEQFWTAYPRRHGDNPKRRALHAWNARLREGVSPEAMIEGAKRYAEFIRADGKESTPYVKQAATFLGPDKSFEAGWGAMEPGANELKKLRPGDPHPTEKGLVVSAVVDGEPIFESASERRREALERLRATDY